MSDPTSAQQSVLESFSVDRGSPIPLWFQVAEHLEHAIVSHVLPQGAYLDNEIAMAERLGVSRPTMRRAMEQLVDRGLVVRRRGIGTRVVQPKVRRPLELTSLYDDLSSGGQAPTTELLRCERVPAGPEVAARLGLDEGTEVVHLERLRSARGEPIARMTNHLPGDVVTFAETDLVGAGLYELLRRSGVRLHSAVQTLGARAATAAEGRLLGEPKGAALLTMERETTDEQGRVVEYASHLYAASRYSFEIHLVT